MMEKNKPNEIIPKDDSVKDASEDEGMFGDKSPFSFWVFDEDVPDVVIEAEGQKPGVAHYEKGDARYWVRSGGGRWFTTPRAEYLETGIEISEIEIEEE